MTSFASEPAAVPQQGRVMLTGRAALAGEIEIVRLPGLVPYVPMLERQRKLAEARGRGEIDDTLLFLEHEHVYTNGWRGERSNLLADDATLLRIGASYHEIERGGDITYHGPGQLVAYPIVDLRAMRTGVREYVGRLERVVIETLAQFGIEAGTKPGIVGVWVGEEKIAAVGVKVKRGIAYHGFALNVNPDLEYFNYIVPCGLNDVGIASMSSILGRDVSIDEVAPACASAFGEVFELEPVWASSLVSSCSQ